MFYIRKLLTNCMLYCNKEPYLLYIVYVPTAAVREPPIILFIGLISLFREKNTLHKTAILSSLPSLHHQIRNHTRIKTTIYFLLWWCCISKLLTSSNFVHTHKLLIKYVRKKSDIFLVRKPVTSKFHLMNNDDIITTFINYTRNAYKLHNKIIIIYNHHRLDQQLQWHSCRANALCIQRNWILTCVPFIIIIKFSNSLSLSLAAPHAFRIFCKCRESMILQTNYKMLWSYVLVVVTMMQAYCASHLIIISYTENDGYRILNFIVFLRED